MLPASDRLSQQRAEVIPTSRTIIHLLQRANPRPCSSLNYNFLIAHVTAQPNLDVLVFSSSLYDQCGSDDNVPHPTALGRQLSAKLHSLFGPAREALGRTRSRVAHPFARSRVYDLRLYTTGTAWGPFVDDGTFTTDWEKVEAIMVVLGFNMELYSQRCSGALDAAWSSQPFAGATPNSYQTLLRPRKTADDFVDYMIGNNNLWSVEVAATKLLVQQPSPPLEGLDPYGVTGAWRRVVCFLDYSDFYAFNFFDGGTELSADAPRPPITTQEAIRLIVMKVRVTKFEKPGPKDGQDLPVVHFAGVSRSMHSAWDPNANSKLRGTVRLTPEGEVRWTTLSIFHG